MGAVMLSAPVRYWGCPSCNQTARTEEARPHSRMHACAALDNMTVPLVEVACPWDTPDARHVVNAREDYIGHENAGPVMSVRTEHSDGSNDLTVYAPTAEVHYEF